MSLSQAQVLFLDLQTTGAKPSGANILEMAWSLSNEEQVHSYLVRQPEDQEIPRRIQFITGIRNEDMEKAISLNEAIELLEKDLSKASALVIHCAQFERPFIESAFQTLEKTFAHKILCSLEVAKRLHPNLPTRGIKGLAGYFGHPSGEFKRAHCHVEATRTIWNKLCETLEEQQVQNIEDLEQWLTNVPKKARTKYEYPLPKEKRLSLPEEPGIYRMISQWGEILYVGKATSLRDRVNSYFRGQKNRNTQKLEMLTQVWDLRVTPCESPLEAALLETDEIKKHNPRYNIVLKTGSRGLLFYDRNFESVSPNQDETHTIGPFTSAMTLDSMLKLAQALKDQTPFAADMFYEELDQDLIKTGFKLFCERHNFEETTFQSFRSILAQGLLWIRHEKEAIEEIVEETETQEEATAEEEVELELTAEDIADKFERHFRRVARSYKRTQAMTRLLNSDVQFQLPGQGTRTLKIRNGFIGDNPTIETKVPWQNHGIDTYDRMTVLGTELMKIKKIKEAQVEITWA